MSARTILARGVLLTVLAVSGTATAEELIIRDESGRRIGTLEPSPIDPEKLIIRDERGLRTGTIEPDAIVEDRLIIRDLSGRRRGTIEPSFTNR